MRCRKHWRGGSVLSVSSVGSEAMQLRVTDARGIGVHNFQYPRSDRRRCNAVGRGRGGQGGCAFSILGRIGGDATVLFSGLAAL